MTCRGLRKPFPSNSPEREHQPARNGSAVQIGYRLGGDGAGEGARRRRSVDQRPGRDEPLHARPGPFGISDGDPAEKALADRLQHIGMLQRSDIALLLQFLFGRVHRARDVDGKHQLEVDVDVLGSRTARRTETGGARPGTTF